MEIEFIDTCGWMAEEGAQGIKGLTIPINQQNSDMMYTINAREARFYPQDIREAAMIFHMAGEN